MSSGFTEKELNELFNDFTFLPMVDYYFNAADTDNSGFIEKRPGTMHGDHPFPVGRIAAQSIPS